MSVAAVVVLVVLAFAYVELAIFAGAYMYLKATQNTQDKEDKKKIRAYSVAAGIFFPVTFAIIAAYKATERK